MRRKLIIMLVAVLFLASLSAAEQIFVHRVTEGTMKQTQVLLQYIREEKFAEAIQLAQMLDHAWDKDARMLEIMVDHGSTDDVRYAFSRLIAALEEKDRATAMVYAGELEGSLEHVYERQAVSVENIL